MWRLQLRPQQDGVDVVPQPVHPVQEREAGRQAEERVPEPDPGVGPPPAAAPALAAALATLTAPHQLLIIAGISPISVCIELRSVTHIVFITYK